MLSTIASLTAARYRAQIQLAKVAPNGFRARYIKKHISEIDKQIEQVANGKEDAVPFHLTGEEQ